MLVNANKPGLTPLPAGCSHSYRLAQQAALFHSIKPLFANKPTLIVANKIDARPMADLGEAERALLLGMAAEAAAVSNGGG